MNHKESVPMYNQQIITQIQNTLQQMQGIEQGHSTQLKQLSTALDEIARRDFSSVQQFQQLTQLCNQLVLDVQRANQQSYQSTYQQSYTPQSAWTPPVNVNPFTSGVTSGVTSSGMTSGVSHNWTPPSH